MACNKISSSFSTQCPNILILYFYFSTKFTIYFYSHSRFLIFFMPVSLYLRF